MAKYETIIRGQRQQPIEAPTGDYRLAVAAAVAMADVTPPCDVQIWCDALKPDYGPYFYRVMNDGLGNLVVKAGW